MLAPSRSVVATLRRIMVYTFLLSACGRAGNTYGSRSAFPDEAERRRDGVPVQQVALSSAGVQFTAVEVLDVDSRGSIYVADNYQHRVTVLTPRGDAVRSIGRRGAGPGEFRAIARVQVLPGDSLMVYDPELARYSVYPPGADRPAYSVKLRGGAPYDLRRARRTTALVAYYRPTFEFVRGATFDDRTDRVRVLGPDGVALADVVTYPSRGFLVAENSIMPDPFGSEGFVRLDSQDRLYYVWSDSIAAEQYDLSGKRLGGFGVPYTAPRVTPADRRDAVAELHPQMRGRFEPVLADSLPDRWPAVRQVIVDDRDRVWMQLGGSRRRSTEWAAFSTRGAYLGSVLVPAGDDVLLIRNDLLYASRLDADDVPRVVVHRMTGALR